MNLKKKEYKLILRIWNIDSFEGGKNSRTAFLRKVSLKFSKKYPEVLCLVENQTVESANNSIKNGEIPDIISSGICEIDCQKYLKVINTVSYNDGGIINGKRYYIAWCKGGYFKIKRSQVDLTESEVIISEGKYNSGAIPYCLENQETKEIVYKENGTAFNYFLSKKNSVLIGTQRDVIKALNTNIEFVIEPLTLYNDLYQYAYITSTKKDSEYFSQIFIDTLLSLEVQTELDFIKMASNKFIYLSNDDFYKKLQEKVPLFTLSPSIKYEDYIKLVDLSKKCIESGDKKEEITKLLKQLKNS